MEKRGGRYVCPCWLGKGAGRYFCPRWPGKGAGEYSVHAGQEKGVVIYVHPGRGRGQVVVLSMRVDIYVPSGEGREQVDISVHTGWRRGWWGHFLKWDESSNP